MAVGNVSSAGPFLIVLASYASTRAGETLTKASSCRALKRVVRVDSREGVVGSISLIYVCCVALLRESLFTLAL